MSWRTLAIYGLLNFGLMTSQGGNLLGKERTSSIPVCLVMNVSGYGIDLHVGNRVIDMEDFLTTERSCVWSIESFVTIRLEWQVQRIDRLCRRYL